MNRRETIQKFYNVKTINLLTPWIMPASVTFSREIEFDEEEKPIIYYKFIISLPGSYCPVRTILDTSFIKGILITNMWLREFKNVKQKRHWLLRFFKSNGKSY